MELSGLAWQNDMAEIIAISSALVFIAVLVIVAYRKGKHDEREHQLANSVDDLLESKAKQEKREAAHDKRVRNIIDGNITADDAGRMLSSWPDKGSPPGKANP